MKVCMIFTISFCLVFGGNIDLSFANNDKVDGNVVYTDLRFQFKDLKYNWKEWNPGKFNLHSFVKNNGSRIWIKAIKTEKIPGFSEEKLKKRFDKWINAMTKKYNWKNLEKEYVGSSEIDGNVCICQIYKFKRKGSFKKEKVCLVLVNKIVYQFRLSTLELVYNDPLDDTVKEFDNWLNTIKFF